MLMNNSTVDWKETKLGDVCSRINDLYPDRRKWHFKRYVGGDDFDPGEIRVRRSKPIEGNEEVMGYQFQWRFQPGDVLYVVKNPRLRKAGMVNFEGICSISSFVIRSNPSKLLQELLPFIFQTEAFVFHACNNAHGSTNPFLNWKDIAKYTFLLPPLDVQKRISNTLWAIEKHIEETEKLCSAAETFRDSLLEKLLTKGIGHTEFKKTSLGEIPLEWNVREVQELFTVETGTTPSTAVDEFWDNGSIDWFTPADFSGLQEEKKLEHSQRKISESAYLNTNLKKIPPNSLLISTRAPVGYVGLNTYECTFNQGCKGLVPKNTQEISTEFYLSYFLFIHDELERNSAGSTFKELAKSSLEKIKIVLAPKQEQEKIAGIIGNMNKMLVDSRLNKESLIRLRKKLINILLNRELPPVEDESTNGLQ
jgi:type I restriction enzyme S subunit